MSSHHQAAFFGHPFQIREEEDQSEQRGNLSSHSQQQPRSRQHSSRRTSSSRRNKKFAQEEVQPIVKFNSIGKGDNRVLFDQDEEYCGTPNQKDQCLLPKRPL